ncbi:lytic transglycosylase domain-containing protein [Alkalilimnicola ehrlichii MLHE-1]|uniref:Lytic transglycosylase, catalytic n=1 Tax=Alkalilimnicola ehrlichii (strain ATCC BAA-1101 / DSM 17681 / MLHE-1) TaxID=187272 RepID=Q0AB95_ALKEH|nr:transglycosylase SLT domain-containing protein [Alkalilimnicola ehrlichii]ABI55892.1 Lytic transglycosylase, catalytic [Alkalilimnicola ehrlichii MLHE-1]
MRWLLTLLLLAGLAVGPAPAAQATGAQGQAPDPALRAALQEAMEEGDSFDNRYVAQVWLVAMSARIEDRVPDPDQRIRLLRKVHAEATRAGLDPQLVLAVIHVESNFNRFAVSTAGARGIMQIMPFWLDEIGHDGDNLFDLGTNLRFGTTILAHYLAIENGNTTRALARYNGSLGQTWYPERVYRALKRHYRFD